MMRSLFSGVSGLQNHQTRMDVIGNNISNVNTTGFKRGRVNFQDMLSQQMSGAARPTTAVGGVNPKEVGLGMTVASIDTIHTQGSLQTTGVQTDLAIQGNGFFVLKNGDKTFYTRAGNFGIDNEGTLVNPANGLRVQGWMTEEINGQAILDTARNTTDLVIPVGGKDPAKATSFVNYACNLNKATEVIPEGASEDAVRENTWSTDFKIYDDFGQEHRLVIKFTRAPEGENRWNANVVIDPEMEGGSNTQVGLGETQASNNFVLQFNNYGTLDAVIDAGNNTTPEAGQVSITAAFDVAGANPNADGTPYRQTFNINLGTIGSAENTVTQFAQQSSTKARAQDGYKMGYLENFKIDQSGVITGVYSNGQARTIGQVAMASFTNQAGLEKAGENTYVESNNSGIADISASGIAGKGKMIAGALEMSNVDLTEQFTDMIITQRGFQASSKTIQTSDTMLETVLNLKR